MKIALVLRGITYSPIYVHHTGVAYRIDYQDNLKNIREQILEPFNNADVYLSTYASEKQKEVLEDIKPVGHVFLPAKGKTQVDCFAAGLELVKNSNIAYDLVIVTRMDLDFTMPLSQLKFDVTKFNFMWEENPRVDSNCVADAMHVFPSRLLGPLMQTLREYDYTKNLHKLRSYLLKHTDASELHYVFAPVLDSNSDKCPNPLYKIKRGVRIHNHDLCFRVRYLLPKAFKYGVV